MTIQVNIHEALTVITANAFHEDSEESAWWTLDLHAEGNNEVTFFLKRDSVAALLDLSNTAADLAKRILDNTDSFQPTDPYLESLDNEIPNYDTAAEADLLLEDLVMVTPIANETECAAW
jgi:hypothetical protein